jgi:hypothetical protein
VWNLAWTLSSAAGDAGYSNVVWDPNSPGNSLRNKALDSKTLPALYMVDGGVSSTSSNGYSSDGAGTVSVDLSNPTLDVVVVENAATLQLRGQSTATAWTDVASYPSVLVVYHQAAGSAHSLSAIQCLNKNNRRVVLGVKKDPNQAAVAVTFPDASTTQAEVGPNWRLIAHFENTPVTLDFSGSSVDLTGGLVTDQSFAGPTGGGRTLHIYREMSPLGLTSKTPRRAWAEGFRMDE